VGLFQPASGSSNLISQFYRRCTAAISVSAMPPELKQSVAFEIGSSVPEIQAIFALFKHDWLLHVCAIVGRSRAEALSQDLLSDHDSMSRIQSVSNG